MCASLHSQTHTHTLHTRAPAQVLSCKTATDGSGGVLHFGTLVAPTAPGPATDVLASSPPPAPPAPAPWLTLGAPVCTVVSGAHRHLHARLHSAGHLLDLAMHNVGVALPAGKGYHFEDGPEPCPCPPGRCVCVCVRVVRGHVWTHAHDVARCACVCVSVRA